MNEEIFVKLHDCFTAGYTLPQYCIDNGIKKPLFVSEKKYELFLWEVYVQFHYDKRMTAQFSFIDGDESNLTGVGIHYINGELNFKNLYALNLDAFDKIILLTKENINVDAKKIISLANLEMFFIQRTYIDIPVLNFLQRYPKVKFFMTNFGKPNVSPNILTQTSWYYPELKEALKKGKTPIHHFEKYTIEEITQINGAPRTIKQFDGTTLLAENNHPLMQIHNGKRMTAYQPKTYLNKIYLFGTCHQYGVNAPFDKTIQSYLQKMLNENNLPYLVENEGQAYVTRVQDMYYNLNKLEPAPGDIILFYLWGMHSTNDKNIIPFCDVSDAFESADCREIYCIRSHVNELGYKLMAEKYFKFLTENNFFRDKEFNYPLSPPPPRIIATAFLLGQNRAA